MFPQTALIDIEFATNRTRMVGAATFGGYAGSVGILVNKFHMFHQLFSSNTHFVAKRTHAGVGSTNESRMLQFQVRENISEFLLRVRNHLLFRYAF